MVKILKVLATMLLGAVAIASTPIWVPVAILYIAGEMAHMLGQEIVRNRRLL